MVEFEIGFEKKQRVKQYRKRNKARSSVSQEKSYESRTPKNFLGASFIEHQEKAIEQFYLKRRFITFLRLIFWGLKGNQFVKHA